MSESKTLERKFVEWYQTEFPYWENKGTISIELLFKRIKPFFVEWLQQKQNKIDYEQELEAPFIKTSLLTERRIYLELLDELQEKEK